MEHSKRNIGELIKELIACQERIQEAEQCGNGRDEALHEANSVFENLFESAPDALVVVDRQGRITRLNAQAERLFGYAREELIGQDHDVLVPKRYRKKHTAELKAYMAQPRARIMGIGLELWGQRKDGSEFPADIDLGPLETDGQLSAVSVVRDVTPRKQLEENLLRSEQRYRDLVELSPDAVVITVESKIAFTNAAGALLFGVASPEQLVGKPVMELVHPDYREIAQARIRQVTEEGRLAPLIEEKLLKVDGSEFYVDLVSMPYTYEGKPATLAIARDITARKQAEMARKASEESYRRTLDSMLEGCQIIGYDWHYLYLNDSFAANLGVAKEELMRRPVMEIYQSAMFDRLKECMEKRSALRMENNFTFPDGRRGWFEFSIEPVPEGIFILSIDITERRKLEEELNRYRQRLEEIVAQRTAEFAQANERLAQEIAKHEDTEAKLSLKATILDNAGEAIFVVNPKGDFVYANKAASDAYGYSGDEFLNLNLRQLLRSQEAPLIESRLQETINKGHLEVETVHLRKDGSAMPVQARHRLIKTLHGELIVSVMRDLKGRNFGT